MDKPQYLVGICDPAEADIFWLNECYAKGYKLVSISPVVFDGTLMITVTVERMTSVELAAAKYEAGLRHTVINGDA